MRPAFQMRENVIANGKVIIDEIPFGDLLLFPVELIGIGKLHFFKIIRYFLKVIHTFLKIARYLLKIARVFVVTNRDKYRVSKKAVSSHLAELNGTNHFRLHPSRRHIGRRFLFEGHRFSHQRLQQGVNLLERLFIEAGTDMPRVD